MHSKFFILLTLFISPCMANAASFAELHGKIFEPTDGGCVMRVEHKPETRRVHLRAISGKHGKNSSGCAGIGESWVFSRCSENSCEAYILPEGARSRVLNATLKINEKGELESNFDKFKGLFHSTVYVHSPERQSVLLKQEEDIRAARMRELDERIQRQKQEDEALDNAPLDEGTSL